MHLSHYISVFYNKYYPLTVYNKLKSKHRIKNKNFSLFCGNCMGGIIYHQLGLPFLSPTVNLRILQKDFYKMVLNLDDYLDSDFERVEAMEDGIPAGRLKDIIVTFTHYRTFEEGVSAWKRRCKKVNFDNLWIIATDRDGVTEKDIAALRNIPCRGLVVFTANKYNYPYCFQLKQFENEGQVGNILKQTLFGKRYFEQYFDYIGWLNSSDPDVEHFRLKV